jgi:hypothetical protein
MLSSESKSSFSFSPADLLDRCDFLDLADPPEPNVFSLCFFFKLLDRGASGSEHIIPNNLGEKS